MNGRSFMYIRFGNKEKYKYRNLIKDIDYYLNKIVEDLPDFLSFNVLFKELDYDTDFLISKEIVYINDDFEKLVSSFNSEAAIYQFISRIANAVISYLKIYCSIEDHNEIVKLKEYLLEPYFIKFTNVIKSTEHLKFLFMKDGFHIYTENEIKRLEVSDTFNYPIVRKLSTSFSNEVEYIEFRFNKSIQPKIPDRKSLQFINLALSKEDNYIHQLSAMYNKNKNDFAFEKDLLSFQKRDLDSSFHKTVNVSLSKGYKISYSNKKINNFLNHLHKDVEQPYLYSLDEAVIILSRVYFNESINKNSYYQSFTRKINSYENVSVDKQIHDKHERSRTFQKDYLDFYKELIRFSNEFLVLVKVSKYHNDEDYETIYTASDSNNNTIRFHILYTLLSYYNIYGYVEFDNFMSVLEDINQYIISHCYQALYYNQIVDLTHFNKSLAKWFTQYDFEKYPIFTENACSKTHISGKHLSIKQLIEKQNLENIDRIKTNDLSNTFSSLNYYHLLLSGKFQYPKNKR